MNLCHPSNCVWEVAVLVFSLAIVPAPDVESAIGSDVLVVSISSESTDES